jgi:hypothetical protein
MEDISRELEKELKAHSRPVPVKRKIKTELYFIDEIGKIASAAWIKPLVGLLAILTLFSTATAGLFVYLYTNSGAERSDLIRRLVTQEKRVQQLVSEKEILMARLVLSGNDSAIAVGAFPTDESARKGGDVVAKKVAKAKSKSKVASSPKVAAVKPESAKKREKAKPLSRAAKAVKALPEKIGVEAIKVINDGNNGDLLVRFNIRNVAVGSNNVSGYIFVILKPDAEPGNDWLVVPTTAMDNGRPAAYRKGQYFSIAHFKPVNFRVKTHLAPDSFKIATVFVYDDDGGLMFQRDMALAK